MPDSETDFRGMSPRLPNLHSQSSGMLRAATLALLVAVANAGCTSSLTAIALRDAMREIAEYGRQSDAAEEAEDDQLVEDTEAEGLMSLEEALDSAVTRLAALGRLDAEARLMLLETLESTRQEDWPVVIDSFASSLEELAKGEQAIEQVAETLETELGGSDEPEKLPSDEAVAAIDPGDVTELADGEQGAIEERPLEANAEPGLQRKTAEAEPETVVTAERADEQQPSAEPPVAARPAEDVVGAADAAQDHDIPAGEGVAGQAVAPVRREEPSFTANEAPARTDEFNDAATVASFTATEPLAESAEAKAGVEQLAERVTSAIRELPVSEASDLSPEERMLQLEAALAIARRQAPLRVDNPCFAWRVRAWGDVERCDVSRFHAGQHVIVYFEVDNLTSDAHPDGHVTKLDTDLRLVNASGECLHEWHFPPLAENRPAPRRDYFARYILEVPQGIAPGPLRLEMTVNDLLGEKSTAVVLPLEVVGQPDLPGERVASDATLLR